MAENFSKAVEEIRKTLLLFKLVEVRMNSPNDLFIRMEDGTSVFFEFEDEKISSAQSHWSSKQE